MSVVPDEIPLHTFLWKNPSVLFGLSSFYVLLGTKPLKNGAAMTTKLHCKSVARYLTCTTHGVAVAAQAEHYNLLIPRKPVPNISDNITYGYHTVWPHEGKYWYIPSVWEEEADMILMLYAKHAVDHGYATLTWTASFLPLDRNCAVPS